MVAISNSAYFSGQNAMHHSNMDQGPNNLSHGPNDMSGMDDSREQFMQYQVNRFSCLM